MTHLNVFELCIGEHSYTLGSSPSVWYRKSGEKDWRYEKAKEIIENDSRLICCFMDFKLEIKWEAAEGMLKIGGSLFNLSEDSIEVARVQYFDGQWIEDLEIYPISWKPDGKIRITQSDHCESYRTAVTKLWSSMGVYWEWLDDPIHISENCVPSQDLCIAAGRNMHDLVIGFIGPGTSFGETVCFINGKNRITIGPVLDGITVLPKESRRLEDCGIWEGDWQESMKLWAAACADVLGSRPEKPRLKGYCSWYQFGEKITGKQFVQAISEYGDLETDRLSAVIQLDDGFEKMPGEWKPNNRFTAVYQDLPGEIKKRGYIPGIWIAPTAVFEELPFVLENTQRVQHSKDTEACVRFSNWNWAGSGNSKNAEKTVFLDPDREDVQEFIRMWIKELVQQGWEYLKLDFLYALSTARLAADNTRTSFESLRGLMKLIRETAGEDIWLCSCTGGLSRYALGYADSTRVGGDTGACFSSVRENLWDYFLGAFTQGIWWQCDPDVFYMRRENTNLSPSESRLITSTIGYTGGCFLTSDLPSQWGEEEQMLISRLWAQNSPMSIERLILQEDIVKAAAVKNKEGEQWLLVYRWEDQPGDVFLAQENFADLIWESGGCYLSDGLWTEEIEGIKVCGMPAHSVTVIKRREE